MVRRLNAVCMSRRLGLWFRVVSKFRVPEHGTSVCASRLFRLAGEIPIKFTTFSVTHFHCTGKLFRLYAGSVGNDSLPLLD